MITSITVRGRTQGGRKDREIDLVPVPDPEDEREWIVLSIRKPSDEKAFATVRVLKRDLLSAVSAISAMDERDEGGRTDWIIEQVKQRRLGYGKAAELLGVPKARFIQMMGRRGVSSLDYDEEDLAAEIRAAEDVGRR